MTRRALFSSLAYLMAVPLAAQSAGNGTLKVKTNSGRTGVFVDGKYLGPAANFRISRKYSLPAGEHELILREPRYEEYKTTIRIEPGKTTKLSQELTKRPEPRPPFGTLRVDGFDKYAAVFLNGSYVGHADEFDFGSQGLLVNPGEYDIEITSAAGASILKSKVTIREDQIETVRAR